MKTKNKKPIAAYVSALNTIGAIIECGEDNNGKWYRTDSDGIRESSELIMLFTKKDIKDCKKQLNVKIAPSTKKLLNL